MSKAKAEGQPKLASKRTGPLVVVALVLLAAWFGWSAVRQWQQASVGTELEQSRDQIVGGVQTALSGQLDQLRKLVKSERVATALRNGDGEATAVAIREGWPGTEEVQVVPASLDAAYADPKAFGYSRLALLEAANAQNEVVARVVRDAGGQRLGLAMPVVLGTQGPALVYVRQPLLRLTATFDQVRVPGAGYVALRLPLEIKDLFREWLESDHPDRARRVMSLVRQMRGGQDYDVEWFKRMTGAGPYAELIGKRFTAAKRRYGLTRELWAMDVSKFKVPPKPGDQRDLFGG